MKTYADLLRGKIFQVEKQAEEKLRNETDSVFWFDSNQIWGYTTKELVKEAIEQAKIEDESIKKSLISMCHFLRMHDSKLRCADFDKGETVAEFIGLNN